MASEIEIPLKEDNLCTMKSKNIEDKNGYMHHSDDSRIRSSNGLGSQLNMCDDENEVDNLGILYKVDETPPMYMCILLGLQHYLSMFFATLTVPFLLSKAICIGEDNVAKAELIGTLFTASGLITLLQTILGCRLPIVQAGTFALLAPTLSYFSLDEWKCPDNIIDEATYVNYTSFLNTTHSNETWIISGSPEHREIWKIRLREIQGAIMVAATIEIALGITGAVGVLLRFIGPLVICPTITLLGLQMFKGAATYGSTQWGICITTMVLMVIFSQYLGNVNVPCLAYTKDKGFYKMTYPLFKMFPIMLSMSVSWFICFILTVTDVFKNDKGSPGYLARTDVRLDVIHATPWFRIPYPGQWGIPTVSIAGVCAIASGILATTIESVGDYHACAKHAGVPPPPLHAVNRGIFVEGLGSFVDGLMGTGNGTTSTSINVGVIGITRVGSRRVVQYSAVFMIVLGIFSKFGALFVTIPEPVIGASFFILFGMIVAVGLSNLQHINMNSGRNLFIIGFTLFNGLAIPQWVSSNRDAIKTGNETVDNVLVVLLSTSMFVGGVLGFILDNTIPVLLINLSPLGTIEERGMLEWQKSREALKKKTPSKRYRQQMISAYGLPFGMTFIRRYRWLRHFPLSPTFGMSLDSIAADEEDQQNISDTTQDENSERKSFQDSDKNTIL